MKYLHFLLTKSSNMQFSVNLKHEENQQNLNKFLHNDFTIWAKSVKFVVIANYVFVCCHYKNKGSEIMSPNWLYLFYYLGQM